jgi:hypothetical protein
MLTRFACASTLTALLAAAPAVAQDFSNDFQISKLGNPQPNGTDFNPRANANFRAFARQFAAVMSSTNGMGPETLGHSGFAFSADVTYFAVDTSSLPTLAPFSGRPWFPSIHIRKGLPLSFEVGARVSWFPNSRMGVGGLELKWAVNEGFAFSLDIAVRGFVNKMVNTRDFDLTSGGLDVGVGKQFSIAGMVTLTPYIGWSLVFVGASTGLIDFRPSRTVAEADTEPIKDYDVFTSLQASENTHNRFYGGLRFIGGHAIFNAEASYSVFPSFRDGVANENRFIPGVLTVTLSLGLDF